MPDLAAQLDEIVGHSPLTYVPDPFEAAVPIQLFMKRDDLLHPLVSGNKWRKLKYNLLEARRLGLNTLLTFGGAYSNHLHATAAAGRVFGFQTIGIVRGDELAGTPDYGSPGVRLGGTPLSDQPKPLNPTLTFCREQGMTLQFVDRTTYRRANDPAYLADLQVRYGPCYILPEGGTNELAMQGTAEIMPEIQAESGASLHTVACAVGTGGTLAGLIRSASEAVQVLGISALKGEADFAGIASPLPPNAQIRTDYHHGGYARTTPELLRFMTDFEHRTGILLEQVYTAKLFFAIYDLARQGYFPDQAMVVAVHTGGLQGRLQT